MRYVELSIRPEGRFFQEVDSRLAADPDLEHGPIHDIKLLPDGTVLNLYEVFGAPETVAAIYDDDAESLYTDVTSVGDVTFVFSQFEPSPQTRALLELVAATRLILERPIAVVDGRQLRAGIVADEETIQAAFEDITDAPGITLEETGEFRPSRDRLYARLTDRQQEILDLAVEMGYYDIPRGATYEDVAAAADCTATTVGDHLRKIERTVLRSITPHADG